MAKDRLARIRMTQREYRANLDGLNIFFGAVMGFVLAQTETLDDWKFAYVLLIISGCVVSILYISASERRLIYAGFTLALIAVVPRVIDPALSVSLPSKVQPTLAIWALMTCLVEFAPRDRPTTRKDDVDA